MSLKGLLNKETAFQSISIVLVFTILQKILAFSKEIVFARMLGASSYGVVTLAFFFLDIVAGIAVLGIPSCYGRYVAEYEKKGMLKSFFKRTFGVSIVVGVGVVIILLLFSGWFYKMMFSTDAYKNVFIFAALAIFPLTLFKHLSAAFKGMRNFKLSSLMEFLFGFLYAAFGISLVFVISDPVIPVIANFSSYLFVVCIFGLIMYHYLNQSGLQNKKLREKDFHLKIFKFSVWFAITPLIFTLFNYIDRLMLNSLLGLKEVGIYSVASTITQSIFMFGTIIGYVLMPNLSHKWIDGKKEEVIFLINFAVKATVIFLSTAAVVLVFFKADIFNLLYGEEYLSGTPLMPMLLVFWLFNSVIWILGVYPQLIERTYLPLKAYIPGLILNVILNYLLIPPYKMMGAAVATMSSFAFIFILVLVFYRMEKLKLEPATLLCGLLPFVLFLNGGMLILTYSILLGFLLITNWIITKDEKALLMEHIKRFQKR